MAEIPLSIYKPQTKVYQQKSPSVQYAQPLDVTGPKRAEAELWNTVSEGTRTIAELFIRNHDKAVNLASQEIMDAQEAHITEQQLLIVQHMDNATTAELSTAKLVDAYKNDKLTIAGVEIKEYKLPDDIDPEVEKKVRDKVKSNNNRLFTAIVTESKKVLDKRGLQFTKVNAQRYIERVTTAIQSNAYDPVTMKIKPEKQKLFDDLIKMQWDSIDSQVKDGTIEEWEGTLLKKGIEEAKLSAMFTRDYMHDQDMAVERAINSKYKYSKEAGGGSLESQHWAGQIKWHRYQDIDRKRQHVLGVLKHQAQGSDISKQLFLDEYGIANKKLKMYDLNKDKLKELTADKDSMFYGTNIQEHDLLPLLRTADSKDNWNNNLDDDEFQILYSKYHTFVHDNIFGARGHSIVDPFKKWNGKFPPHANARQKKLFSRLYQLKLDGQRIQSTIAKNLDITLLNKQSVDLNKYLKYGEETGIDIVNILQGNIKRRIEYIREDPARAVIAVLGIEYDGNPKTNKKIAEIMIQNHMDPGENLEFTVPKGYTGNHIRNSFGNGVKQ